MKKIKRKITILLGFLILSFIFWNKFIRIRLPKDLEVFSYGLMSVFITLTTITFLILLIKNFKVIFKKYNKEENTIVDILLDQIAASPLSHILASWFIYLKESPKNFYEYFFQKVNVVYIVEKPLLFFMKHRKHKIYIYVIGYTLPKCILSVIFLFDIFYFKELNYFYKSLPLLAIPLILNAYRYLVDNLTEKNLKFFCAHITFTHNPEDSDITLNFEKETPNIEDAIDIVKHKNNKKLLQWFAYNIDIYSNIKSFLSMIKDIEDLYKPYENIFKYGCYVIGWSYILYVSFHTLPIDAFSNFPMFHIEDPFSGLSL